jgi:tetratricopeptide (TPR) repeat protein
MSQDDPNRPTPAGQDLWTTILFTALMLLGLALLAVGVWRVFAGSGYTVLALGVVALVIPASAAAVYSGLAGPGAGRAEQVDLLGRIAERVHMSDLARRMADRVHDRQHLRDTIIQDIENQDYEAALALVDEMAEQFGYVEEAEQYRQRIIDARARRQEQMIEEAIQRVDRICAQFDWALAKREIDRLERLFPDDARIAALPRRVEQAKADHKRDLEREFLRAADVGNTDRAMALLKELDRYLTAQEAEAYQETARGVISQARENVAVRFRMAVSDRDWIAALNIGEQIIRDFPNSQMAEEARGMMDVLRERAAGQRAADAGRAV